MTKISQLPPDTVPGISDLIAIVNSATSVTSRMTLQDFSTLMNTLLHPSGIMQETATATAPTGWLICDGSAISRSTYSLLFTAIGTTYGTGDGSTTFNIPDMRQRFALGKAASGTGNALGATGGAIDHKHLTASGFDNANFYGYGDAAGSPIYGSGVLTANQRILAGATATANQAVRVAYTDVANPPFLAINYIIKT